MNDFEFPEDDGLTACPDCHMVETGIEDDGWLVCERCGGDIAELEEHV